MSVGKYSPVLPKNAGPFIYNAKGDLPDDSLSALVNDPWNEERHFPYYDAEGFDSYGYSAYSKDGKYVGAGQGIDRVGKTEQDYHDEYMAEVYARNHERAYGSNNDE